MNSSQVSNMAEPQASAPPGRSLALPGVSLTPQNILATVLVVLLTVAVRRRYLSTISDVPGPFLASITRLWHIVRILKGRVSQDTRELHQQYGPFVRIAPDEVSVSHPDAPRQLLLNTLPKGYWYEVAAVPDWRFQTPLSTTDPKKKTARSKAFASGYTLSNMLRTEEHIDRAVEKLLGWMDRFAAERTPMALDLFFSFTAFDIIGEVLFSRPFGFLDKGADIDGTLHVGQPINAYAAVAGYVGKLHRVLANPVTTSLGLLPTGFLFRTAMAAVRERRRNSPDSRYDVVAHWLRAREAHPERLSLGDLHANLITNVGAGSDATSCALQSFIYHMLRHPACWARARAEVDEAAATATVNNNKTGQQQQRGSTTTTTRVVAYELAQGLPYFQACLKEALRLFSPQGLGLPRVAPPGGLTLGDRTFSGGTILSIHPRTIQLDPAIWGPDADQFKPERWLADDAASKEKYWLVFGLGYASCPGQHLARIELSKILSTIVRDYDIVQVNPGQEWKWRAYFATLPSDWPVYVRKREQE